MAGAGTWPARKGCENMADIMFKEDESNSAFNTAIAATAQEEICSGTQRVASYNRLLVQNRDGVDIQILLDNATGQGKIFEVQGNGGIFQIEPTDGIWFCRFSQKNLHAAMAETANKILFRWAFARPLMPGEAIK
jgi:hypothetical protein